MPSDKKINWTKILQSPDVTFEYDRRKQYEEVKQGLLQKKEEGELDILIEYDDDKKVIHVWRNRNVRTRSNP